MAITSRQHPLVKTFRRAARGDQTVVLVDGWHLLKEAAGAGLLVTDVAVSGDPRATGHGALVDRLARGGTRIAHVSSAVMDALSPVRTPTGVTALVRRPPEEWAAILAPAPPLILLVAGVQDPGNVGATIRSAEAGGATGVVLAGPAADPWGWKALRSAMGSTFRLPIARRERLAEAVSALKAEGVGVVAAVPGGGLPMERIDLRLSIALLLGPEGPGLDEEALALADQTVSIPMRPPVESLNVAVAAALLVYEAHRQRTSRGDTRST
jgi:TrmH family RNA methyltransferase